MDSTPPMRASSPRSLPPAAQVQPLHLHGKATGAPMSSPPPPPPANAPCSPLPSQPPLHGQQATAAPTETPPPAPAAPSPPLPPYTAEWIFRDFARRRAALIRALTLDQKKFFRKCKPGTETLYLYGNSDGSWEVLPPKLLMPPTQHDPRTVGVKLVRRNMGHPKWLRHIAKQCDAWLTQITSFLDANLVTGARQRLSARINSLYTVHETLIASDTYRHISSLGQKNEKIEDEEDEGCGIEPTICASCGSRYCANGFWICCDVCDRWFHGKCVKVTAAQAEHIKDYECPECCSEKKGHDYDADPVLSDLYKRY